MSTRLEDLQPDVQQAARSALASLDDKGILHAVTSTYRSVEEQAALYAQGRLDLATVNARRSVAGLAPIGKSENSYTVTNCDGIITKSNHQGGRALDVVPVENGRAIWPIASDPRWQQIADVMKASGFEWGGDWTDFPDRPHYQMA